ncbi:MAG: DNA alkylation repair protein [Actinomycetota bacterium]
MAVQTATAREMMKELMVWTSPQNVKVYRRHGAGDDLFGVSFADLRKLARRIRTDHVLALELWESGNVDARLLAAMIADPGELTPATLDSWIDDVDYYAISDELAELISRSPLALETVRRFTASPGEYRRACGYAALAAALKNGVDIPDDECRGYLRIIEEEIHASPNRARYSMNSAVIAIGVFKPALTADAKAAAARIGKVVVDHGDTVCRTPDAATYIEKALARRKQ